MYKVFHKTIYIYYTYIDDIIIYLSTKKPTFFILYRHLPNCQLWILQSSIQAPSPCAHQPRRSRVSWPRWKVPVPLRSRCGIVVESWLVNEYVDTNQVNLGDIV